MFTATIHWTALICFVSAEDILIEVFECRYGPDAF